ncbi:MAG: glutathione S-transferase [Sphingopyxis macrogoltabida]|uniref:Glutathione S-transferase n=1 Tax=Sphingopyxis macrogoltabida TaxID=33050 RepID=A0A2W5L6H9_SPHMC|nr:MAG: glutathione S-transferase [Sphingopyxis macrogoltabida]
MPVDPDADIPDTGIIVTVFANSPDRGRGLARDMAVRWALEETGQVYRVRPLSFAALKEPAHRARQPFGQIPAFERDGLTLFESGAIVLHVAERHGGLLPADADARARAITWMFAAVSTVEPPIVNHSMAMLTERDEDWYERRLPMLTDAVHDRLAALSLRLGDGDWLDGGFSAGDLMTIAVLRRLNGSGLLDRHPVLSAYIARGEARPAFIRAFDAQRALFIEGAAAEETLA